VVSSLQTDRTPHQNKQEWRGDVVPGYFTVEVTTSVEEIENEEE
jgi:hypothetical protein